MHVKCLGNCYLSNRSQIGAGVLLVCIRHPRCLTSGAKMVKRLSWQMLFAMPDKEQRVHLSLFWHQWHPGQFCHLDGCMSSSFLACNSRLRSAVRRPHPPQRPVLDYIHCLRQCEIMGSQILLYSAQPCDAGASSRSPPVLWSESWQDPLGICVIVHTCNVPRMVRRRDWTIADC